MSRRNFLKVLGGTAATGITLPVWTNTARAAEPATMHFAGTNLDGWYTVLGDGLWHATGQAPVHVDDVVTHHTGDHSILFANVQKRGVMAHNITYTSITDETALDYLHTVRYRFRLPYIPHTQGASHNAQTFEGGFFIWDGSNTRLDYGLAFQWILNPWMSTYGQIRCWASDPTSQWWAPSGYLAPDTEWHTINMVLDYRHRSTSMLIDNVDYPSLFTETPKSESWGQEMAARLQAEIISIWPGNNAQAPEHLVEVKDWDWTWQPYPTQNNNL